MNVVPFINPKQRDRLATFDEARSNMLKAFAAQCATRSKGDLHDEIESTLNALLQLVEISHA